MSIRHLLDHARACHPYRKRPDAAGGGTSTGRRALGSVVLAASLAVLNAPSWAQTADDLAKDYKIETMEQALQTRDQYDLYGLHFASDQATIEGDAKPLLDDIATMLKNFPEWHLRIVGHTDATADPAHNEALSLERANAIKAALVERGVEDQRLATAGAWEKRPVATNTTPEGRSLNRRVELAKFTDSAQAKELLKSMSEYLAKQQAISFNYNATLEVVTNDKQKLALASSGALTLNRPDKIRAVRSGGFVDVETLFDGKTLTLLGKNANKYTQADASGTVEQLIDQLREKYDRPLPAADLLTTDAYSALMEDVYDSKDLGSGVINGVECDFLAFRKDEVDLQMWIAQGDAPSPCKYVITSRLIEDGPQYTVEFGKWQAGDAVAKDDFAFQNAANAEEIDLKDLQDKISELPGHFVKGDKK